MPTAPGRLCRCGGVIRDKVCNRCGPQRERTRTKAERPHNTRRWQAHSKAYLGEHPLCVDCEQQGRTTLASEVHHMDKARQHQDKMFDDANLVALCQRCHAIRTRAGQ